MDADQLSRTRGRLELQAALPLLTVALMMAMICAGIIAAGWFAGSLDGPPERVFWLGSALAGVMVFVLAGAAFPGGDDDLRAIRRIRLLLRIGLMLFIAAPALIVGALIVDYFT